MRETLLSVSSSTIEDQIQEPSLSAAAVTGAGTENEPSSSAEWRSRRLKSWRCGSWSAWPGLVGWR